MPRGAEREFIIMEMNIIGKAGHEMTVSWLETENAWFAITVSQRAINFKGCSAWIKEHSDWTKGCSAWVKGRSVWIKGCAARLKGCSGSYNIVVFLTICISYANNCFTL